MIDLHCHILPGLDDGAADEQEALAMARLAAADGVHTIVATPHVRHDDNLWPLRIKQRVNALNELLVDWDIPITILAGAEVGPSCFVSSLAALTLAETSYILVEFPCNFSLTARRDLAFLQAQGLKPVIAHPERNESIIRNPDLLLNMLNANIFVQITAGSITGEFGATIRECAIYLLQQNAVHFIASDGHSSLARKPRLGEAVNKVSRLIGRKKAEALVTLNPRSLLNGKSIC